MNLQDALAYRTECLIHKQYLQPHCITPLVCEVEDQIKGIKIAIEERERKREQIPYLTLNYDGTWEQEAGHSTMNLMDTTSSIRIMMLCPECFDCDATGKRITTRSTPITPAVKDIHRHTHNYTFVLKGAVAGKFECEIESESFHYSRDGKFYQVISQPDGSAKFFFGSCDPNGKVQQLQDNSMKLDVPHFNFSKIKDMEKLLEKIQIYNLFS